MRHFVSILLASVLIFAAVQSPVRAADPLVYEGDAGPAKGKHIVFIADDHEYRSEETLPALARILAKRFGCKCTVVFGLDKDGVIVPGVSNVPGIEALDDADLMVIFTRFQNWPEDQMNHFVDYLDRAGPVVGLRTATHAFKGIPKGSPYEKYNNGYGGAEYKDGFGRQVLGEKWAGHYGPNHRSSTRLDLVGDQKDHPVLRGVKDVWVMAGAYFTDPLEPSTILAMAQPLNGMTADSPVDTSKKPVPGAWVRTYSGKDGKTGRVFTSTYGCSSDITNAGYRRMLVNACLWAMGLDDAIQPDLNIDFVGPYNPTWHNGPKRAAGVKPADLAGWDSPIFPLAK
ncbi:MAG: hypothetical protein GC162_19190 [Planctomycetes bacterium]|nr:hypothetical protein [Planctomycetota bacterium]